MSNTHFIKVPCHQSDRPSGFECAPDYIKKSYDYVIDKTLFNGTKITEDNIVLCPGYNLLYKYILSYTKSNPDTRIITIGGDNSISTATIAAMNEKYLVQYGDVCNSKLKVLYIDLYTDLATFDTLSGFDLSKMTISSLFGLNNPSLVNNKLLLDTDQILYIGLLNEETDLVSEYNLNFITLKKINQIGIDNTINIIKNLFGDDPIHISLDMKTLKKCYAPTTMNTLINNENGLELDDLLKIFTCIKDQVVSLDITEFNPYITKYANDIYTTKQTIHKCLVTLFDIKEKNINIFNEFSEFIIFRPATQIDNISDNGWYIMRGMTLKERDELIKKIPDGKMIAINIDNKEYYIAKTNMNEQNNKSIYTTNTIEDFVLFPDEKKDMCFELLNTNNIINVNNTSDNTSNNIT